MSREREILHAPWRMPFVLGEKPKGCFLCAAAEVPEQDASPAAAAQWKSMLLLARTAHCTVVMNRYPYNGGHLLVSPREHTADYGGLADAIAEDQTRLARTSIRVLQAVMQPHGFNMGMNLGRSAGAGVEDHLHLHVIPRWTGDTNFLPIVSGVDQLPLALDDLYDKLLPEFKKI